MTNSTKVPLQETDIWVKITDNNENLFQELF